MRRARIPLDGFEPRDDDHLAPELHRALTDGACAELSNDDSLLLSQPQNLAQKLAGSLRESVARVGTAIAHCSRNGIWRIADNEKQSVQKIMQFLQRHIAPACKQLLLNVAKVSPIFGSALQTIQARLTVNSKFAKNVAQELVQQVNTAPFNANSALLATPTQAYAYDYVAPPGVVVERAIRPSDFVSRTLPYALPGVVDAAALAAIESLLSGALAPGEKVYSFVHHALATIALSPANMNRHVWVIVGDNDSGKSTLVKLVCALFGSYAVQLPNSLLAGKKEASQKEIEAALSGARIAYIDDPSTLLSVESLKRLTNNSEGAVHCHFLIATTHAKFRSVLADSADESIGGRVSVLALPKRFVAPQEYSEYNADTHPLALPGTEVARIINAGAPSLMRKLLFGDDNNNSAILTCHELYNSSGTTMSHCEAVEADTQRLLEPLSVSVHWCAKKWLDSVRRTAPGSAQPLLIRKQGESVDVDVLVAHYQAFVSARRAKQLVTPKANENTDDDDSDDSDDDDYEAYSSEDDKELEERHVPPLKRRKQDARGPFMAALVSLKIKKAQQEIIADHKWTGRK
jgi:hypothetical protein